ncbi:hypothetical protein [Embleya sp. NPDC059259]|uniref:hypothetical protein n=1 Tax=unclassified Embleya TaxID=2699296 RepID=UPI0036D01D20
MTSPLALPRGGAEDLTAALMGAVTREFRTLMGFDPTARVLVFPTGDPLLGADACAVEGCDQQVYDGGHPRLCGGCSRRMEREGRGFEEFVATTKRHWKGVGVSPCRVPDCGRPWKTSLKRLCAVHDGQRAKAGVPVEEFVRLPQVRPLPRFGPCHVAACPRDRDGRGRYCAVHTQRRAADLRRGGAGRRTSGRGRRPPRRWPSPAW